jgi:hypothetical protein
VDISSLPGAVSTVIFSSTVCVPCVVVCRSAVVSFPEGARRVFTYLLTQYAFSRGLCRYKFDDLSPVLCFDRNK